MLARAWSWQRAIDKGRYANGKELAEALGIDRSRSSRTLRLAMLSPRVVHRIVTNDIPSTLTAMRLRGSNQMFKLGDDMAVLDFPKKGAPQVILQGEALKPEA